MKNFHIYLKNLINSKSFNDFPIYFQKRIIYAERQLTTKVVKDRTIQTPSFLNDLGVRYFTDPKYIYHYLNEKGFLYFVNLNDIKEDIKELDIQYLGLYIDAYFLVTGDYKTPYEEIKDRIDELDKIKNHKQLIFIASLFAALQDDTCENIFHLAYKVADNIEDKVATIHRISAYTIKRKSDSNTENILNIQNLYNEIRSIENEGSKQIYTALANNLLALLITQSGISDMNILTIKSLLQNGVTLIDTQINGNNFAVSQKLLDQSKRYRGQIQINYAQLLLAKKEYFEAKVLLEENLSFTQKYATDYVPEALALYAQSLYLNKEYTQSLIYAKDATTKNIEIGAFTAAKNIHKIVISSLTKLGNIQEAEEELKKYNKLGERIEKYTES